MHPIFLQIYMYITISYITTTVYTRVVVLPMV